MSANAILQIALAALPLIQTGVPQFVAWLQSLRSAAKQAGEWTDAQEQQFRTALVLKAQSDPAYKPDP